MADTGLVRKEISVLLSQSYGDNFAVYFNKTYAAEILPIFVHNCYLFLRDQIGIEKTRQELNQVLFKYDVHIAYE